jgi:hypothetical protein
MSRKSKALTLFPVRLTGPTAKQVWLRTSDPSAKVLVGPEDDRARAVVSACDEDHGTADAVGAEQHVVDGSFDEFQGSQLVDGHRSMAKRLALLSLRESCSQRSEMSPTPRQGAAARRTHPPKRLEDLRRAAPKILECSKGSTRVREDSLQHRCPSAQSSFYSASCRFS